MKKKYKTISIWSAALIAWFGTWIWLSYYAIKDIESPEYNLIEKKWKYEIREYKSFIVAETNVIWNRKKAMNQWFRILANYIFWGNTSSDSISMTSPVMESSAWENQHLIQFTMPSSFTLKSLPIPNSTNVTLKKVPKKTVAVLKYSGYNNAQKVVKMKKILLKYLDKKNITYSGSITSASYNPPLSFPLMRRNEVMIEIHI